MTKQQQGVARWRLVLGRYAQPALDPGMSAEQLRMEQALDFLYSREYSGRGVRQPGGGDDSDRGGTLDPSQLNVPRWLGDVHELFPRETAEVIEKHALERYGMTELITDPEVLEKLEANVDLLKTILTFRGQMQGRVLEVARRIVHEVIEEIKQRIENDVRRTMAGKLNRFRHSPLQVAQNFDWRGTIRKNLKNYNPDTNKLLVEEVCFFSRIERRIPWDIILCVDQSGSMADSVIHSAVMAGIIAGLPALELKLVVFDTSVVDLTEYVDDPVEVLMSVQLGGGTNIGQAVAYAEGLVENPRRTIFILVTDFEEGGSPRVLVGNCRRLAEAGVKLLGLASLDERATPVYDVKMAQRLADVGMEIAALTPKRLAEWLVKVIS